MAIRRKKKMVLKKLIAPAKMISKFQENRIMLVSIYFSWHYLFFHPIKDFANLAEAIFRGSDRHADLDKAYTKLVGVVFEQIDRVANEHQKTPKEVVLMGTLLCNICCLFILASLNLIHCLQTEHHPFSSLCILRVYLTLFFSFTMFLRFLTTICNV